MKLPRMFTSSPFVLTALLVLASLATTRSASAYGFSGVGGKLGYTSPEDMDGTAALGLHAEFAQAGTHLHLLPNMTYWKVENVRDVSPNFDVYYHFNPEKRVSPYLGGGVGLNFMRNEARDTGETQFGMNFLGGVRFPGAATHYFLEGRYTASDTPQAMVLAGVTFLGK